MSSLFKGAMTKWPVQKPTHKKHIKTKVSIYWQLFKGRIPIHYAVGTAGVCNELY